MIAAGNSTFSLIYFNAGLCLIIPACEIDFTAGNRNRHISWNDHAHPVVCHFVHDPDAQRVRIHIRHQDTVFLTNGSFDNSRLDCRSLGNCIIRIHCSGRFHIQKIPDILFHNRHAGRTAHQNYPIDLGRQNPAVRKHHLHGTVRPFQKLPHQFFKLLCGNRFIQRQRLSRLLDYHGNQHMIRLLCTEGFLAAFRFLFQTDTCIHILPKVHAVLFLKLSVQPVHEFFIKILSSKPVISVARFHFQHSVKHFQKRNVEGTAAQIIDQNMAFLFHMIQTITQRCSSRFIYNTLHLKSCFHSCSHGCLSLDIVKISRHRDHCPGDLFLQIFRHIRPDILQKLCGKRHRRTALLSQHNLLVRADFTLYFNRSIIR